MMNASKPEERKGCGGPDMGVRVEPMWFLVHILTIASLNPNSSSLLPQIRTFSLFMPRNWPLCQLILLRNLCIQHSGNTRSHDETVFLSGTLQLSWRENSQNRFFFIPVLYVVECPEQTPKVQSPGRGARHQNALHSVCFTWWAQCPCTFCSVLTTTIRSWTVCLLTSRPSWSL